MPNMNMVSTAELTQMQADAARGACDQSCTVKRATLSTLASGGQSETWNTVLQNGLNTVLVGMAEPTAGQLQNYGYLIGSLAAWQVKFPVAGTNVQERDQLFVAGQVLNVAKDLTPRSYPTLITVLAVEVK